MRTKLANWTFRFAISLSLIVGALMHFCASSHGATVDRYWEFSPYRVQLFIKLETSSIWREAIGRTLPEVIDRRAGVAMGPLWRLETALVDDLGTGDDNVQVAVTDEQLAELRRDFDKLITLVIRETPMGLEVSAQEYDSLVESWGPVVRSTTADGSSVAELAFATVHSAFAPMAKFRVDRENPGQVELSFRGESLPQHSTASEPVVKPGDILRPVLRRVDRTGLPVEDGIQSTPWTFFSVNETNEAKPTESDNEAEPDETTGGESETAEASKPADVAKLSDATIYSHTRFPFSARQRGRVEQLALKVNVADADTRLRLHARDDSEVPLVGFKVFTRNAGEEASTLVGKTGRDGSIAIPPGKSPIQIAFVQSSGQWIAKIPLVPGADGVIEAPLVDDRKRLEAEARLVGIREELIDMVARRNILAARARSKIKAKDIEGAERLIRELEDIPTATEFEQQRIRQQERMVESSDPRVQARISKLFNDTRDVLAEFMAPGLVQQLKRELIASRTAQQ